MRADRPSLRRSFTALGLFGLTFGFIEAAVVVDLRAFYEPIHQQFVSAGESDSLFPLLRLDQIEAAGPVASRLLLVELARELATLGLLAAMALALGSSLISGLAGFVVAFGLWDLWYYVFLKLLLGWPASLMTWDLLFLWPVPWSAPVLAPVLVSLFAIAAGAFALVRESQGRPIAPRSTDWLALFVGAIVLVIAFCWDWRNVTAGGLPRPFRWDLYTLGLALGLAGYARAIPRPDQREHGVEK